MKTYKKPDVIPAKVVMQVHKDASLRVLEAKQFLEQASPVFYERFLNAIDQKSLDVNYLTDPIENEPEMKEIIKQVRRKTEAKLHDRKKMRGFCHLYWHTQKRILKERYNIQWFSPVDLNPGIWFD